MFNRTVDVVISSFNEQLIEDKIIGQARMPETFNQIETQSRCPFSKFAKSLPKLNVKHCSGIQDLLKQTLLVSSWSDIHLQTDSEHTHYMIANPQFKLGEHSREQFDPLFPGTLSPKLMAPLFIDIPKDISVMASEAFYHFQADRTYSNLRIPSGIIKGKFRPNVITLMPQNEECFIKYNDPLMYLTLLTDRKIKIHYELIKSSEFEHKVMQGETNSFIGGYRKHG
jgi:hypothetical protein